MITSDSIYQILLDLSTDDGINASGKEEIYGCIFGRDSALTILKILRVCEKENFPVDKKQELAALCKRALLTLINLQGKETNLESGEEPGKFVHEFRKEKFEHLLRFAKPWYVYPEGVLKNYDSLDSTPLALIAIYQYWQLTQDHEFLISVLPAVESGLNWIISYGDIDKDGLLEYVLPSEREHGGLVVQSWTDSNESLLQADGSFPLYPIAPVEVQSYAWLALRVWSDFYNQHSPEFGKKLLSQSQKMKDAFNSMFLTRDHELIFAAQALDGQKNQIPTITGNPLITLWSTYQNQDYKEAIVEKEILDQFVKRAFVDDLFDADGGIRTMSTLSSTYNPNSDSYHNGSFWPVLNGLISEGLTKWNYIHQANQLKEASLKAIYYFDAPIELYMKNADGNYMEYLAPSGQVGCRTQAWSAAAVLDWLT